MRFLCEQCKAKYQIADEKVAGKTVRMKCRKCGHLIEVKADVTETSVATKAPQPPNEVHDDATRVGMDVGAMMKLSPGAHHPTAPTKPAAPRPGAGAPAKPGLATSLASAKPAKPTASPTRPEGGALAGAFQKSVAKEERNHEIASTSEWYVAINGVPVGPVRIAELRRKAASGAVTEESLVWQEGMEEWRALRTIAELVAIVHEGLSSERPSLVTPAPPSAGQRPSSPPRREPSGAGAKPAPPRSNVVSLTSRLATAEKLEPEEVADPFAARAPISGVDQHAPHLSPAANELASPLGVAAPTVVIPRKASPNWIVIGMVVAFGAFGVTAGIAVFFRQPPVQQAAPTIVVTQAAPTTPAGQVAAVATDNTSTVQTNAAGTPDRPTTNGGGGRTTTTAATASTKGVDPSIAALLGGGVGGPSVGGGGGGGGGGSALSEESIQRVVQQRSAGVKRTCWERGGGTESNVNVRVHLTIAATGGVQSASSTGNDPIVNKCIENSVRNWTFPASSGPTDVDIPFHFLRQ